MALRVGEGKQQISLDSAASTVADTLVEFQDMLLRRATEFRDSHTRVTDDWDAFVDAMQTGWRSHCTAADRAVRALRPAAYGKRVLFGQAY